MQLTVMAILALKALGAGLLACILYVVFNPWHRWVYRRIPGPAWRPIFGNLLEIKQMGSHELFVQCHQQYGPVFKIWFGHKAWVIVADPDLGKRVNYRLLNRPTSLGDPLMRGPVTRPENKGLFFSRDDMWRRLHKLWEPAFYVDSVHACAPRMVETTRRMVARLRGIAEAGEPVDMWREVGNLTMQIVGEAAFGIDFHTVHSGEQEGGAAAAAFAAAALEKQLGLAARLAGDQLSTNAQLPSAELDASTGPALIESAKTLFTAVSAQSGSPYQLLMLLVPGLLRPAVNLLAHACPDAAFRKVLRARITLGAASNALVEQARAAAAAGSSPGSPGSPASSSGGGAGRGRGRGRGPIAPGSFLGLMMGGRGGGASEGLSNLQMLMQANTFTLAGYETTANCLAFTLFCLSSHPEAEARVLDEIRAAAAAEAAASAAAQAAGEAHTPWHSRDLEKQFPYLSAVISESLRLYPPGANTMREVADGTSLALGPYTLPAGTTVVVASYVMQRDPATWPRALEFLPERFLPGGEHLAAKNPAAYLPFGSGARMCIGQRFAIQEVRLGLVELLQHFAFDVAWQLMSPPPASACPEPAGEAGEPGAPSSCRRALRTRHQFTLSPHDGIWMRVLPRPAPPGAPLLSL